MREELKSIREQMKKHSIDYYIIPTDDFHLSEYVADYFKSRKFISGFTGSSGTLIISKDFAGLWTDSRYFLQAQEQLNNSGITLKKYLSTEETSYPYYLSKNLPPKSTVGFDARCMASDKALQIKKITDKIGGKIVDIDIVDEIWTSRPKLPKEKVYTLDESITGESTKSKIKYIRNILKEKRCTCHIITSLDEIAYLLNMRGSDIPYNPVFLSFLLISDKSVALYIDSFKLDASTQKYLGENNINIKDYDEIYKDIQNLKNESILIDKSATNYCIYSKIPESCKIFNANNPTILKKSIKNSAELKNMIYYHKVDGVSMIRWIYWLKKNVGKEHITEISCDEKMQEFRNQGEGYKGLSFNTIAGYMEHGAIVHYSADSKSDKALTNKGILLFDSGGQYLGATTDITRTIALGEVTEQMKKDFTIVLKGHLALSNAKFPYLTTGTNLDTFARKPLWENGLDYGHGTGHGVGCFLCVHEGPQRIAKSCSPVVIEEGMVISNEPGVYRKDEYGIRIENLIYCKEDYTNEMGRFMKFVDLTLVPIDLDLVDKNLMTKEEITMLNNYHKRVYDEISPMIKDDEVLKFLQNSTRKI